MTRLFKELFGDWRPSVIVVIPLIGTISPQARGAQNSWHLSLAPHHIAEFGYRVLPSNSEKND
jgi:hypothetical protein